MQSCYHHSISNLRISSYIDRDTQGRYGGGGGVGGDNNIRYDIHHVTLAGGLFMLYVCVCVCVYGNVVQIVVVGLCPCCYLVVFSLDRS